MIDPNVGRFLDGQSVAIGSQNILADDVSDDDIGLLPDEESHTHEFYE